MAGHRVEPVLNVLQTGGEPEASSMPADDPGAAPPPSSPSGEAGPPPSSPSGDAATSPSPRSGYADLLRLLFTDAS